MQDREPSSWPLAISLLSVALAIFVMVWAYLAYGTPPASERALTIATWWLVGVTVALVLVAAVQAALFLRQLRYMREGMNDTARSVAAAEESLRLAREDFTVTHRPWISVVAELAGPLVFTGDHIVMSFRIELLNTGKTPAMNVEFEQELHAVPDKVRPDEKIQQLASRMRSRRDSGGSVILPQQTAITALQITLGYDKIREVMAGGDGRRAVDWFGPVLLVCVGYWPVFPAEKQMQTGVVRRVAPRGREVFDFAPEPRRIELSALSISQEPFGGDFAN